VDISDRIIAAQKRLGLSRAVSEGGSAAPDGRATPRPEEVKGEAAPHPRLRAMMLAARYFGIELDPEDYPAVEGQLLPAAASLSAWAQNSGMWSRAIRLRWRHLFRLDESGPVVLLLKDGGAGLLVGADTERRVVLLKDPMAPEGELPEAIDEMRLAETWSGETVLLRANRSQVEADMPFSLGWLAQLVLGERKLLRDIGIASLTISFLTIFPAFLVMTVINKVLVFHSSSTLTLLAVLLVIFVAYETMLGHARRLIVLTVGTRIDAKLSLHVFSRLLRLPLDYFEHHPAGETMSRVSQLYKVRDFLTGKLLTTFLDLMTLCVLLPFLFYLNALLAGIVLACACVITLIILAFLKPIRVQIARVIQAEINKHAVLGESVFGVKTVKALALEPQRKALWDERVAEAGNARLRLGTLANWPQTLTTPVERFMWIGVIMIAAGLVLSDKSGYMVGGLFAFMMLSQRVSQPLAGMARLVSDLEEVGGAIGEASYVLNRPIEADAASGGLRPRFDGAIAFDDVTFIYPGTKRPALERVSFAIPAGTMLGVVGRSGSGKSTVARLLQGINRDYSGYVKLDGNELREINLRHLRQNFGVVLQENFLFRGSISENITADRPGLTLDDVVRAARLAGAADFIERMPNGYASQIEEGSPNLSGGQRQRLAIARALIRNPRLIILDEATSALDPESEALVNSNLLRIAHGRTMVIVSHRLSSLTDCDQILVLDDGKVMDLAPHLVLLERCMVYRHLWAQQNRHLQQPGSPHGLPTPALLAGEH
jgi:ATP-binding cassette, subfamily B, bacterial HlyB/CyaB